MEIGSRSSEQACNEINAIVALMNVKVTQTKYTQQGVGKAAQMIPSGSFEYSPFSEKEMTYLKVAAMTLVSKCIDKEELVQFTKPEEKKEEVSAETTEETKEATEEKAE